MKNILLQISVIVTMAMCSLSRAQTLQPAWSFSLDVVDAGSQIDFIDGLNAGSDGSVGFIVGRTILGVGQRRIFWLKADANGDSPTAPLWSSPWLVTTDFPIVQAIRRNHLVYSIGRELRSVTLVNGTPTEVTVNFFSGTEQKENIYFNLEQARSPSFFFAAVIGDERDGAAGEDGFTVSAFRFAPAPPAVSAVPTFTSISGESLSISFQTQVGVTYQLQSSTDLTLASWQPVGSPISGNDQLQTLIQPSSLPRLFFRVVAL